MKLRPARSGGSLCRGRGLLMGDADGQAVLTDELRARRCSWPPLRLAPGCAESTNPSMSRSPPRSRIVDERRVMRAFGLDVHRDFCEVAIAEDGEVRSA